MRPLPRLQDLPPKWARFCLGVGAFVTRQLACDFTSQPCIVACSGGADSTALLLLSTLLCRKNGGQVIAVHLDHCLREDSAQDACFVARLCENWNIPLILQRENVQAQAQSKGLGLEEAGRLARYELLERVRRETASQYILLGHQLNDLAEDQLLRLMRGVGWPALGGMAGQDPARGLVRPLLLTPRAQLEEFLKAAGLAWRVDQSNFEGATTRNRVRLDLLPVLLRENPAYLDAAARLWRQARVDEDHWDSETARMLSGLPESARGDAALLPTRVLEQSPAPLRLRLYKAVLERLGPGQPLSDSLFRLDELWREHATGKKVRFPGDKEARLTKAGIAMQVIDRKKECG
jgi:tRNA(Ile)-lysidine synthase